MLQDNKPKPKPKTMPKSIKYTSDELRDLVSRVLGGDWGECSHDDGCFHRTVDCASDCCDLKVDLREFLSAEFGGSPSSWRLEWDPYTWRYSAYSD